MTPTPTTPTEIVSTHYLRLPDCPHCGTMLLPPESSEFLGAGCVRHTWSCEDCGQEFRLAVNIARGRVQMRRVR
jgi:transcription elongation factor Elf1